MGWCVGSLELRALARRGDRDAISDLDYSDSGCSKRSHLLQALGGNEAINRSNENHDGVSCAVTVCPNEFKHSDIQV